METARFTRLVLEVMEGHPGLQMSDVLEQAFPYPGSRRGGRVEVSGDLHQLV